MWILSVRSPANEPRDYEIRQGKNTLGRKPENDIVIADDSASRQHAEIYCQRDLVVINDLDSTNGTYVNKERIQKPQVLHSGDQVRIGQHIISVSFQDNSPQNLLEALSHTRPLTRDLLLESIEQHAIFMDAVASRLTTILDLDAALQEITELLRLVVGAEKCRVILADQFDQLDSLDIPGEISRQVIEQHSLVIIPNLSPENGGKIPVDGQVMARPVLVVPVMILQDVVAVIYVYKSRTAPKPFTQHEVQLVVAISHQAALTIQHLKLLEESKNLERMAFTDSLTGIFNRRRILQLVESEFQRARRYKHSMTLLVVDLDDLKMINDTYGHTTGDMTLQAVSDTCKRELRSVDVMGRIGGDEFVIMLVETNLQGGFTVAERIRKSILTRMVDSPRGPIKITISIGIVSLSETTPTSTELFNQADKALIKAKKTGKDQVVMAE